MNPEEEHRWSTVRDHACQRFGETPGAQLEADIMGHFADDPERVERTINRIADQHAQKRLGSPWAVTRADLNRKAQADITVTATASRDKAITNAEHWLRNAGLHYDRQDHVLADLFGDEYAKGPLTPYDTPELRTRIIAEWQRLRPAGVQAELDHEAWNAKCKQDHGILLAQRSKPTSEDIDFG